MRDPAWSPDGKRLAVVILDRVWTTAPDGRDPRELTRVPESEREPAWSPDGKHIVFVHRRESNAVFHIALLDIERDRLTVLTQTSLDESPSVAPNGTMLIYATQDRGRGILAVVSIDGRVKYRLPSAAGDVREPDWSPYLRPPG